jgi:hypothetical protein
MKELQVNSSMIQATLVIRAADAYERAHDWKDMRPKL